MRKRILPVALVLSCIYSQSSGQWNDQGSGTTSDLNGVHFIDNNTGWAVGRSGTLITTSNGGSAWTAQNSAASEDLNGIFMVSSSLGYAVGNKGKISKYNGSSWSAVNTGESRDVFGVYFVDNDEGWAVGDWGRLYHTTNGGSSWINQNGDPLASYKYNDVHMTSNTKGWAVGTSGRIVKYNGSNWASETSGVSVELLGTDFLNDNFGFAVGESSTILFYNGSSWSTHNAGLGTADYNIYEVSIVDQNLAYAVASPSIGGAGVILRYNGSTWSKDYEYSGIGTELFYGLSVPSASKGVAVGAGGMIKAKSSGGPTGISTADKPEISLKAWPNPFTTGLQVSFNEEVKGPATISLIDIHGREVKRYQVTAGEPNSRNRIFETSVFPAGTYFLRLSNGEQTEVLKVTKE